MRLALLDLIMEVRHAARNLELQGCEGLCFEHVRNFKQIGIDLERAAAVAEEVARVSR